MLAAALWWGSLTAVGFLVVPMLFAHLGTPAEAGRMAARLFSAQTWVGIACGVVLLMAARTGDEAPTLAWGQGALVFVILGMLLALLQEFAVAPRIVARDNLRLWHGVGTALYAAQWLCALAVLWKLAGNVGVASRTQPT
ncbi:MAG TPA: DUF4149 domain-containing protein [Ramlibacter sp.]|nr:DUF4149 domain-containing protein [Ramlibacter sp.]